MDPSGPSLPDATNDQGLGGHAYLDPSCVEYDWQLRTSDYRFILKPQVTYTMTNSDGSLFGSGTYYITEDTKTSLTMNFLVTLCFNELSARYAEIRDIPLSHQEAIAWTLVNDNEYIMSWSVNDYAPDLELSITSNNTPKLVVNGSSIGSLCSKDCVDHDEVYIDPSNFTIGIRGYDVVPYTIPRGKYTAVKVMNLMADVINEICVSFSIGKITGECGYRKWRLNSNRM